MAKIRDISTEFLNDLFKKGLNSWYWDTIIPHFYSPDLKNTRIKNGTMTIRKWHERFSTSTATTHVRGMSSNAINDELYTVHTSDIFSIDTTTWAQTKLWDLRNDNNINFVNHNKYVIILDGAGYPMLWDGATLSTLTSSAIEASANPDKGVVFADFTVLAGTGAFVNKLYISRPITATTPANAYNWDGTNGSDIRDMRSNILWLASTNNMLVIFTEDSIETMDRTSVVTVGWDSVLVPTAIAEWDQVASQKSIVAAGDMIFFLTKDKQIKTVNYVSWVTSQTVGTLSDRDGESIQNFMNTLDDDQGDSFGYFNRNENLIKRFLKTKNSNLNDICLVWDLINKTRLVDENKYFSGSVVKDNVYYTWSFLNWDVYIDETDTDDDTDAIARYRWTPMMTIGDPFTRKVFRGFGVAWQINDLWSFNIDVYVDWEIIQSKTISGGWLDFALAGLGITGYQIAWEPIAWDINPEIDALRPFFKKISKWNMRSKWKYVQIKFYWDTLSTRLALETASLDYKPIGDISSSNKL